VYRGISKMPFLFSCVCVILCSSIHR